MKTIGTKYFLFIVISNVIALLFCGNNSNAQNNEKDSLKKSDPRVYIGLGEGINEFGFGGGIEVKIAKNFSLYGNTGYGGWGWKYGGGMNVYFRQLDKAFQFNLGFGYSHAPGIKNQTIMLKIEPNDWPETVEVNLNKVGTINLSASLNWNILRSSKLVLTLGYAIPLKTDAYEILSPGVTLTNYSEWVLKVRQPGGIILGGKFMIGF